MSLVVKKVRALKWALGIGILLAEWFASLFQMM